MLLIPYIYSFCFFRYRPVSYQVDPPDHWELLLDNIVFGEAIGEGAFGKVYCATVSGAMLRGPTPSCESLDTYVRMEPNTPAVLTATGVKMKAAVKIMQGMLFQNIVIILIGL